MNLTSLLTNLQYFTFNAPTISGLNGLIAKYISLFPSIALGVIVFTLTLKLIALPLDFVSRYQMRKNSLKMEEMRPQLEKLQKQYANDKDKYNQKMMALYKKNGYSMFGSCLPLIVSMVFFIIAINAFTSYSNYQNIKYIYNMNNAYNQVITQGIDDVEGYVYHNKDGEFVFNHEEIKKAYDNNTLTGVNAVYTENTVTYDTGSYIKVTYEINGEKYILKTTVEIDSDKYLEENAQEYQAFLTENSLTDSEDSLKTFITEKRQSDSAKKYYSDRETFIWVKNIWMPDTPFEHPIYSSYSKLESKYKISNYMPNEAQYEELVADLSSEMKQPNGYLIFIVLTAGLSLLSQLVMTRSQKAQMELQTVDGQGASQQKIMMWIMPIMMGIFAFSMTSAFSLYMVISSLSSMLITIGINKIVDIRFKKEKKKAEAGKVYRK